jgi:hypothetical protein
MSSLPPPPIREFYDSEGDIMYPKVYEYLNSLFGATEPNYTRKITFKLPSLAVPAIFNEPTQKVSVNENNIDPNIKPFTLYQFFDDSAYPPYKDYQLFESMDWIGVRGRVRKKKKVIIKSMNHAGRFVFIVPIRINSENVIVFTRQSSTMFLNGKTKNWTLIDTKMSNRFEVYTQYFFRIGSKRYPTYKALYSTNPKTRTLNFSRSGFQT